MANARVVVDLKRVENTIPRNKQGDPAFVALNVGEASRFTNTIAVFTPDEVVALVNRAIYQMEYSREAHRVRGQRMRDLEAPVKAAFKQLFPGTSWINGTPDQLEAAIRKVKEEKDNG
jgi:hypothetical protein